MIATTRTKVLFSTIVMVSSLAGKVANARVQNQCRSCTPTYHGPNGKIQHPEIAYTFWQSASNPVWTSGATSPNYGQMVGFMQSMGSNTQYWAGITTPGLIAPPRVAPYANIFQGTINGHDPDSPANCGGGGPACHFNQMDIEDIINLQIDNGKLPPPQTNDDSVYVVATPGNRGYCEISGGLVDGTEATWGPDSAGLPTNAPVNPVYDCNFWGAYHGVPYIGIFGHDLPGVSHELVEGISSYEGIYITNCQGYDQIGDLCGCGDSYNETVNGFNVASYYSTVIQPPACVVPESYGDIYEGTAPHSWQLAPNAFPVRQAYVGSGVVIATDANEDGSNGNDLHYSRNGGAWTLFGTGGATFATGGGIIAQIGLDADLYYYDVSTGSFTHPGPPLDGRGVATGVTVTAEGIILATDSSATPWYWNPSSPGWVHIAGPGDQFVAMGNEVLGLNPWHNEVFQWYGDAPDRGFTDGFPVNTTGIVSGPDLWNALFYTPGGKCGASNTGIECAIPNNMSFSQGAWIDGSDTIWAQDYWGDIYFTGGIGGLLLSGNNLYAAGCLYPGRGGSPPCVVW